MVFRKERYLRFPGGLSKTLTLSYDDGVEQDMRLVSMLREAGVKGTFNINAGCFAEEGHVHPNGCIHRRMSAKQCKNAYTTDICEVAVHGYNHPWLTDLDSGTVIREVIDDRLALESMFGPIVKGMAYPFGPTNDTVVNALRLCGISYARTTESTGRFEVPTTQDRWLRLPATCHHNDKRLPELCRAFLDANTPRQPLMFYLWGHSYEFDEENNWDIMGQFLEAMKGRQDIWYATNGEIYRAWKNFTRLEATIDGSRVHNPNCDTVWFADFKGNTHCLLPGETVTF